MQASKEIYGGLTPNTNFNLTINNRHHKAQIRKKERKKKKKFDRFFDYLFGNSKYQGNYR